MPSVTINASPIICLSHIGKLHLIPALFKCLGDYTILTTSRVASELKDPITRAEFQKMVNSSQIIVYDKKLPHEEVFKIAAEVAINSIRLDPNEHLGEAEIILLAEKLDSDFVIIDENAAKPVIRGRSHLTHLQVLDLCVENSIITPPEALKILESLKEERVKYKRGVINYYEDKWGGEDAS